MPTVYAFAPPPCVSRELAEKCKSELIVVKGLINRDDFVCRASASNARALASEIKARRTQWEPLLRKDFSDIYKRTLTLWAPMRRTKRPATEISSLEESPVENKLRDSRSGSTEVLTLATVTVDGGGDGAEYSKEDVPSTSSDSIKPVLPKRTSSDLVQEAILAAKDTSELTPLLVAGNIVHIYQYSGTMRASVIDYNFWVCSALKSMKMQLKTTIEKRLPSIYERCEQQERQVCPLLRGND